MQLKGFIITKNLVFISQFYKKLSEIIFLLVIISCAAISPPSGGPEDDIPPVLISSIPESGALQFNGGEVILQFSEYLDKNSVQDAFAVSPRIGSELIVKYNDDNIIIDFPDSLLKDQTYVISIGTKLKDERGVSLENTQQIAFSTGSSIDNGKISGRIYGGEFYSAHLWKLNQGFSDSIFFTKPLYIADADELGNFNFNFLSSGEYSILAIEKSAAGLDFVPERMSYGFSPNFTYFLENEDIISDIPMKISREEPDFNYAFGEWIGKKWGKITFNRILESLDFGKIFLNNNDKIIDIDAYQNPAKKEEFLFISKVDLEPGNYQIIIKDIKQKEKIISDKISFNINVSSKIDSSALLIEEPTSVLSLRSDKNNGPPVSIVFSKPILSVLDSAFFIVKDSNRSLIKPNWKTPMLADFLPVEGWSEKNKYQIVVHSDKILPIDGRSLIDSLVYINIDSGKKLGYGSLIGKLNLESKNGFLVGLQSIDNESNLFFSNTNIEMEFNFQNIVEGKYKLIAISDRDNNRKFSKGSLDPLTASEWFYEYPDTFEIRTNWEIDLGMIEKE